MENELAIIPAAAPAISSTGRDLLAEFRAYVEATTPTGSADTVRTYLRGINRLFEFLSNRGANVFTADKVDLLAWKAALKDAGRKASTIQVYLASARIFYAWLASIGAADNITLTIKREFRQSVDKKHKRDPLTPEQLNRILALLPDTLTGARDRAIIMLMIGNGLRCVEISRANIHDYTTGAAAQIRLHGKGRTDAADVAPVRQNTRDAIDHYLNRRREAGRIFDDESPLFSRSRREGRMTPKFVSWEIKSKFLAAGVDSARLTPHSIRHTAARTAFNAGASLSDVQAFMRHSNPATTQIYLDEANLMNNPCGALIDAALFDNPLREGQ